MAYTAIGRIRFRMRGAWAANTSYEVMDVVRNTTGTIAYMAKKAVPQNTDVTNSEYWAVLVDVSTLKGDKGDKGDTGSTGAAGVSITAVAVDSSGHLQVTLSNGQTTDAGYVIGAKGDTGNTGAAGADGEDGVSITAAAVDSSGHLKLTLSSGTVLDAGNVKGDKGDQGQGITILGSYDSESALIAAHPTGSAGDAYLVGGSLYVWSATESEWVNVGSIQGPKGDKGDAGDAGADGADGADGYTPVRGTDYWTAADIAEIQGYVDDAILGGEW